MSDAAASEARVDETVSIAQRAERWWHIVRAHRPSQLGWRTFNLAQRRLFPLLPKSFYVDVDPASVRRRENDGFAAIFSRQLELRRARGGFTERVAKLLAGDFCFLNESRRLGTRGELECQRIEPVSHLWRFHLHYQEFLLDLLAGTVSGEFPAAAERIAGIVDEWIRKNPLDRPGALRDAWHPYCLSRRIPVWLLLWHAGAIPAALHGTFVGSLESQVRYLERHLEWDLRGNHLWENLRAVALAGAFCAGSTADRRLAKAGRLLKQQFAEQVLAGGEHFERSPMYHAQMLAALLDVRDAAAGADPVMREACGQVAQRMAQFLAGILHPDGQIPLLSDSVLTETPSPRILIDAAHCDMPPAPHEASNAILPRSPIGAGSGAATVGDYWTWRDGTDFLLFDHGAVGADELPAHAHNDLLTIEASLAGRRLVVDSGIHDYEDSSMRRLCRSTAAHNVLQVDHREQCDLWSRFRMGRRGRPVASCSGTTGEFAWCCASHDAFARWGTPVVGRWIACRPGGPWIVADWSEGKGKAEAEHQLSDWLHLAPETEVQRTGELRLKITSEDWEGTLAFLTPGTVTIENGWYCPEFGVRHPSQVVQFARRAPANALVVWTLDWTDSGGEFSMQNESRDGASSDETAWSWDGPGGRVDWCLADIKSRLTDSRR